MKNMVFEESRGARTAQYQQNAKPGNLHGPPRYHKRRAALRDHLE